MKILVLDNYDSFTYNLVQYLKEISSYPIDVFRNDAIDLDGVNAYDIIVLSPGPGLPDEAGIMPELIKKYAATKAILGVCLGHQAITEAFGGSLENLSQVYHGIETTIQSNDATGLFKDIPEKFNVGRYHSWVATQANFPNDLSITATADNGMIMALSHKIYCVKGVQFHPESVMTKHGKKMLSNFLELAKNHYENNLTAKEHSS